MNQLAMIAKGGESTALSSADGREDFASDDASCRYGGEIRSAFCKLSTAELLRHLLSARVKTNDGDGTKKNRRYDSSEAEVEASDASMTKPSSALKSSSDICASDNVSPCAEVEGYDFTEYGGLQHGRMDKQCDVQEQSDDRQSRLFASEVQTRENVSEESSLSDEEISNLSKSILESNAFDFILSGTEEKLCIQSPSQNDSTSEYSNSEFSDFTELLPYVGYPSDLADFPASTSGTASGKPQSDVEPSVNSDKGVEGKTGNQSDQDVEKAMVLVPSGHPHHPEIIVPMNQRDRMVGGPQEHEIIVPIIQRDRMVGKAQQRHEIIVPHFENKKIAGGVSHQQYNVPIVVNGPYELVLPNYQTNIYISAPQQQKTEVPIYEENQSGEQKDVSSAERDAGSKEKQKQDVAKPNNKHKFTGLFHYKEKEPSKHKTNSSSDDLKKQEELITGKGHNNKIVGGHGASIADYPYQLSLVLWMRFHFCGAVLIAQKWALTAAHCTYGKFAFDLSIRAGSSTYGKGGQMIPVSQIVEHESYFQHSVDYDISILELASEVNTKNAKPIGLATTRPKAGDEAIVSGWGRTSVNDRHPPSTLQAIKLPVVDQKTCKDIYDKSKSSKYKISDRMFCAGPLNHGGEGTCLGDSGGPITVGGKLAGLVSWGRACAVEGYPGVFSSVADLKDWIEESIKRYTY